MPYGVTFFYLFIVIKYYMPRRDPTAKLVIDTALDMQQEQRQMVKTSDIVETLVQRYINTISFEDVQQTIENRKKNKKSKDK